MRLIRDLSIKKKLRLIIMLTVGAALALASFAFISYDQMMAREAARKNLSVLAEIIGNNSTAALTFNDPKSGLDILEGLQLLPHIEAACIYTGDGKVFVQYRRAGTRFFPPPPQTEGAAFGPNRLTVFYPITLGGQRLGTLYLESDLGEMRSRLRRYLAVVLAILLGSSLLALFLSARWERVISEPILHLAETAHAISQEKNYARRAVKHGQDEFGLFTDAFNEMLSQIQHRDQELERHREHLEEEVAARTKELSRANQELKNEVSERQRAEEALRESEEKYRVLIETTGTGYVIIDSEGRVLDANAEYVRLSGRGALPEILGQPVTDWTAPHDLTRNAQAVQSCAEQGFIRNLEIDYVNGAEQLTPVEINATTVPAAEGIRIVALCREITERKRAEQARAFLASIVECSEDAIIAHTLDGKIASWNRGAEVLYGYRPEEVIGKPVSMLVAPERVGDWRQNAASMQRGERVSHVEGVAVRKDGGRVVVSVSMSPIRDAAGQVTASAAIVTDITERKRVEVELRRAKEGAEAASRAKSEFLANMSHEIRTPMNGIIGMTELALDTNLDSEQREYLDTVKSSAEALLTIINDILDFSKIEAGRLELDLIDFDLRDSLEQTTRALALRAHQKGLELVCDVRPEVPAVLVGDPTRLRQIIINLVGNAIKFTEKGEVVVRVEKESEREDRVALHFAISDTGIGIPPEKLNSIFEPFVQADGSSTRKFGGTGLGLTISTQLVALMGGRMSVESEAGRGSVFHFTVPCRRAKTATPPPHPEPLNLAGIAALVVDDNATNRRILEELLRRWQMKPRTAEGGQVALNFLRQARDRAEPFPLVLTDAHMPEMDGFALAAHIKQDPTLAGATIMMLTSGGQRGDAARCRELGVAVYLTKPIREAELHEALLAALGAKSSRDEEACLVTRHSLREQHHNLRVLLAEDNAVNQQLVLRLLQKRGYSVVVAANGREALNCLEESGFEGFDVVLMDVQMPEMGGYEATAAIRAREKVAGKHVPIIALTAHAMKGDREQSLAAGMDGYVSKPIRVEELLAAMQGVLAPPIPRRAEAFDHAAALARLEGDAALLAEMAGIFIRDCPGLLTNLHEAVARGDAPAVYSAAHALKGSVANFSASAAVQAALRLETMGRQGDLTLSAAAWRALEEEIARLQQELEALARGVPQ
ncbi:MAG: response regulator [Acidobacteriia bacterium]|nr:response regulator [Terriglobia bacterium]